MEGCQVSGWPGRPVALGAWAGEEGRTPSALAAATSGPTRALAGRDGRSRADNGAHPSSSCTAALKEDELPRSTRPDGGGTQASAAAAAAELPLLLRAASATSSTMAQYRALYHCQQCPWRRVSIYRQRPLRVSCPLQSHGLWLFFIISNISDI